jgi:DNA polymerase-3 subunit epsilon
MVKNAPTFADVADQLRLFLGRGVFAAHNAGFDYGFIKCEFERLGQPWERPTVCTLRIARKLYPDLPSRSLGNLCEHLLIEIFNRHRAAGDAEATIYVLKHMLKEVRRHHGVENLEMLEAFLRTPRKNPTAAI